MAVQRHPSFDERTAPLAARVATGLHKIGLAMKHQTWREANDAGLSPTQGQILALLVANGPLTGTELSRRLGVTLPTVSDSVRVLVEKRLVTRSPDPRHPRGVRLAPTRAGAALGTRARSWPELMADAVNTLAPDEQRALYRAVLKMVRTLQEQGLVPMSGMCVTCVYFRPHVRAGASPHHCAFVDAPLPDDQLRLDCPDQALAPEPDRSAGWARFLRPHPAPGRRDPKRLSAALSADGSTTSEPPSHERRSGDHDPE